ncbi:MULTISPECIES: RNA polymerase sigma factor [Sphingobacterium]|uniref:RNA polymerase sigma factor n=1 Tax=Sphingobacterium TaxID=28453 RepID=UPI0013D9927C|nr:MULTISPECIES: RNA polymerase sigma-70 factor [unclassified Sphingobacterium]
MAPTIINNECLLLARIAKGDQQAFEKIYVSYFPKLYTFAYHILKSKAIAQEVAQEIMLSIWLMGEKSTTIQNLDAYLKTLAKRRAIDQLRRIETGRKAANIAVHDSNEIHNETEESVILKETKRIIEEGIDLLPPQQKLVYQLCKQQELKYEEVALQLNISPGTVHRHMKLALQFLRAFLKKRMDIPVLLILMGL